MKTSFSIEEKHDEQAWDNFISAHDGHLLQTVAWGELKSRFGWSAQRLALEQDGARVAAVQVLYRQLPLGLKLAYVPRGPVVDPSNDDALTSIVDAIIAAVSTHGAFALKFEPNWKPPASPLVLGNGALARKGDCFQPHITIHVDLTRDLDAILAQMKPKWRYNIRLAERKGVIVREGTAADLSKFYELLKITSSRDGFAIHTLEYYRAAFELLTSRDQARLFIAEYAGEPIAAIFVTAFANEAIYLYGASGNTHREKMPNHALHWHAIQWAKALGCAHYDLWGVGASAEADTESSLSHGLYQFKQGFGGRVVVYSGAYDIVFSRWKFALYERALALRRGAMG